jgi:hypothetical protein
MESLVVHVIRAPWGGQRSRPSIAMPGVDQTGPVATHDHGSWKATPQLDTAQPLVEKEHRSIPAVDPETHVVQLPVRHVDEL